MRCSIHGSWCSPWTHAPRLTQPGMFCKTRVNLWHKTSNETESTPAPKRTDLPPAPLFSLSSPHSWDPAHPPALPEAPALPGHRVSANSFSWRSQPGADGKHTPRHHPRAPSFDPLLLMASAQPLNTKTWNVCSLMESISWHFPLKILWVISNWDQRPDLDDPCGYHTAQDSHWFCCSLNIGKS